MKNASTGMMVLVAVAYMIGSYMYFQAGFEQGAKSAQAKTVVAATSK